MLEIVTVMEDFFKIIDKIDSPEIKAFVYEGLNTIPEDFWSKPTSSSGKHHPPESNITPMGILVHNIKACTIAKLLFPFYGVNDKTDRDIIIAAIVLHDSYKGGWTDDWNGMIAEHGYIAASYLAKIEMKSEYIKSKILLCIECHMSRWSRPLSSAMKFMFPDKLQLIVALSDMIASGKNVSFYPGIKILDVE